MRVGFLVRQFSDLAFAMPQGGKSTQVKIHRITESGLAVKAARIKKSCTLMRFETKTQLQRLCNVIGESLTAGQRCRVPKIASPKFLEQNDVVNVICGADNSEPFDARTERNGIDLEFDGSNELFITILYRRYGYTTNLAECDPLLSSLIRRCDLYSCDRVSEVSTGEEGGTGGEDDTSTVIDSSEFEDVDRRRYGVTGMDDATHVFTTCFYP
jgi:hypothetical protein